MKGAVNYLFNLSNRQVMKTENQKKTIFYLPMWWQRVWENHSRRTLISSSVYSLSGKITQVEQVPLIRRQLV